MKKFSLVTTLTFAAQLTGLFSYQIAFTMPKTIYLSVTNKTEQTLVIAARYAVLPPKDPNLMGMPNPFKFVEVPANKTIHTDFNSTGGGRLGNLEEIVVRTQDHYAFKTLDKKALNVIKPRDVVLITVDKDMLPK